MIQVAVIILLIRSWRIRVVLACVVAILASNCALAVALIPSNHYVGKIARIEASWPNLKLISLAMINYESAKRRFPYSTILSKDGKPLLSWRVQILPYLEEAQLYDQFRLDEPWDSPHNVRLLEEMPAIFRTPDVPTGMTRYQVFTGPNAVFDKRPVTLADIRDGPGSTILVVEGREPVPWTKPDDLAYLDDRPIGPLGMADANHFLAVMADGSINLIHSDADPHMLRALISLDGDEAIDWSKLCTFDKNAPVPDWMKNALPGLRRP